jgi:hypothetical protein
VDATIDTGTDDVFRRRQRDFELPARLLASPSYTSHFAVRPWQLQLHRSISSMRAISAAGAYTPSGATESKCMFLGDRQHHVREYALDGW